MSDVKFVAAQYNYDGSVITFLFSAEQKIDTSVLQKRLQRRFEARIEMRQIGPRDVAKLLGGFGACGITRCCSTFLTDFSPISIKMAKAQGISLNPLRNHRHVRAACAAASSSNMNSMSRRAVNCRGATSA